MFNSVIGVLISWYSVELVYNVGDIAIAFVFIYLFIFPVHWHGQHLCNRLPKLQK